MCIFTILIFILCFLKISTILAAAVAIGKSLWPPGDAVGSGRKKPLRKRASLRSSRSGRGAFQALLPHGEGTVDVGKV